MRGAKHFKQLLQAAALAIFLIQLGFALDKFWCNPSMTVGETKEILSLQSSILITICKMDQIELEAAANIGYEHEATYYIGHTGNFSYTSWTGNGTGNLTSRATLGYIFNSELENIGKIMYDEDLMNNSISEIVGVRTVLPYGQCKYIENKPNKILQHTKSWKNVISIYINDSDSNYQLFVSDPNATPNFQLPRPQMTGDKIRVAPYRKNQIHYYNIRLKETLAELSDGSCTDYPDAAGHHSFSDCVEDENKGIILPVLGCLPPWLSRVEACTSHIIRNTTAKEDLSWWFHTLYARSKIGSSYQSTSCLRPCKYISVHSVLQDVKTGSGQTKIPNKINLFFEDIVGVEIIIPAYGITSLLVEIGSSLGLWLGLSVVGILDVIHSYCLRFVNNN